MRKDRRWKGGESRGLKYASKDGAGGNGFERVGGCERGLGECRIEVEIIVCRNEGFVSSPEGHLLVVRVNVRMVSLVLVEEEVEGVAGRELNQSESVSTPYAQFDWNGLSSSIYTSATSLAQLPLSLSLSLPCNFTSLCSNKRRTRTHSMKAVSKRIVSVEAERVSVVAQA